MKKILYKGILPYDNYSIPYNVYLEDYNLIYNYPVISAFTCISMYSLHKSLNPAIK